MIPAIYLKLRLRTPIPLSPNTFKLAVDFFRKNPDRDCYVMFDGRVVGGDAYRKKFSCVYDERKDICTGGTYGASVAYLGMDGIPMNVGRGCTVIAKALGEPDWFELRFGAQLAVEEERKP